MMTSLVLLKRFILLWLKGLNWQMCTLHDELILYLYFKKLYGYIKVKHFLKVKVSVRQIYWIKMTKTQKFSNITQTFLVVMQIMYLL